MDGDGQYSKDHDQSQFPSRLGMGRRAVPRPSGGATNRFRQTNALPSARGDATVLSQATGRPQMPSSSYVGYGYTDTAFQVQQGMPQLQPYPSSNFTQQQQQAQQQQQQQQQQQLQPSHSQHHPSFNNPYEQAAVYNLPQQGPTHGPYDAVPQYPTRQSAATIDALSSQFAVPQYFPASEPTGAAVTDMVSPYLNTQLPPYNQPGPIGRSSATAHPFAANMVDLNNPMGTTGQHYQQQQPLPPPQPIQQPIQQPQPQQRQPVATVSTTSRYDEVRGQLQRAFRWTLDQARAGRVVEASRSILEISDWLVVNVREIGFLDDDKPNNDINSGLWSEFNLCWLSICQMQRDLTENLLQHHPQTLPPHVNMLSAQFQEHMGHEMIRFSDQMEQHGLVDYEMGIWEEEILSALTQNIELMESRPDILHAHPMPAAPATSRS